MTEEDSLEILALLKELDLYYPGQKFDDFRVARRADKIVGVVELKESPSFFFLSSLGVAKDQQKQGIASEMINEIIDRATKDIYLYTVIPDFFKQFGFQPAKSISGLPSKLPLDCENCQPDKCVTMIYSPKLHRSEGE